MQTTSLHLQSLHTNITNSLYSLHHYHNLKDPQKQKNNTPSILSTLDSPSENTASNEAKSIMPTIQRFPIQARKSQDFAALV